MPEELSGEIGHRHVAQQLRVQLAAHERLPVGVDRDLLVGTALDVVEHRSRQLALGDGPEVVGHVGAVQQPRHRVALETTQLDQFENFSEVHGYSVFVMAPVSAPCTSFAYLPSTPLV